MGPLRCKKSPNPPAQKAREGEESPDAPVWKSAWRWGVTWCPDTHPISLPDLKAADLEQQTFFGSWRRSAGTPGTRPLLPGAVGVGKIVKRPREEAPRPVGDSASCLNFLHLCNSVCSLKCIHLRQRALSSSLSQYNAAHPASERYGAADHTGYSHAALTGDSNDQAAMSVPKRVKNLSKNLT